MQRHEIKYQMCIVLSAYLMLFYATQFQPTNVIMRDQTYISLK